MNQLAVRLDVRVGRLAAQDIDRAAFQIVWLSSVPEERTRALLAHAPGSLIPVERLLERAGEHGCLGRIVVDDPNPPVGALVLRCKGVGRRSDVSQLPADDKEVSGLNRSEEHTSELQSLMRISYAVFCLKTKKKEQQHG